MTIVLPMLLLWFCFLSRVCPIEKLEFRSFFELDLYGLLLVVCVGVLPEMGEPSVVVVAVELDECDGDVCIRDSESMCLTFDVSVSRFAFGESLTVRVGDIFVGVEIGIDELLRLVLPNEVSLRKLCTDSGRCK